MFYLLNLGIIFSDLMIIDEYRAEKKNRKGTWCITSRGRKILSGEVFINALEKSDFNRGDDL